MIHLENKIYLLLLLAVPLIIIWQIYLNKTGKRFIFYSSKKLLKDSNKSFRVYLIKNLIYFKLIALILLIMALARPQIITYSNIEKKMGIDILVSLDISGSMASFDFKPKNRLEVAKDVISDFIQKRITDKIGLVIFAGTSYTKCPLTVDYEILKYFLKETDIGELEDGTAIGMALAASVNRLRYSETQTKIIILLTDGVNNRGEIDPRDAAGIAKDFNIKVYTIGVGTMGQAPYPVIDASGRKNYVMMNVEIDEKLLQEIANNTGGLYFRATDKDSLQQIFAEIDRWEKSEISIKKHTEKKELFIYFMVMALILILLAEFGKRSYLRSLP